MSTTITVTASNQISLDNKVEALKTISNLSDLEIQRLCELAKSAKARNYLNHKWVLLKQIVK